MNKYYMNKLVEELQKSEFSSILISPGEELNFLMQFNPMMCERFQGLFVKKDGTMFYICNLLYEEEFKAALPEECKVYPWFDGDVMTEVVGDVLAKYDLLGTTIAVNSTAQAFNVLEIQDKVDVTFKNGKPLLERMRMIKNEQEMQYLRESSAIVDQVFLEVLEIIKPGMTEAEIGNFLMTRMTELGGSDAECIVAVRENAGYPHYSDNKGIVKEHDLVLMDYGCTWHGLWSDMTRTVFVGEPTEREREIYELVRRSQQEAEDMVCLGAYGPDIDKHARAVLDEKGYAWSLINRLGHGIGYSIHEAPDIKQSNPMRLEIGMAFSIEPGIYLGGDIGVRIEDIVMINEKGEREVLNKVTKELIVL